MDEESVHSSALLESHPSVSPEEVITEPSQIDEQCCDTGKDLRVTSDSPKRSVLVNKDSEVKHSNVSDAQTTEPNEVQNTGESGDSGQVQSSQHDNLLSGSNSVSEQCLPNNNESSRALSEEHYPFQDNQNTSLTSSPNSCSTSGQDSGVSPDDSGSDIARVHNFEDTSNWHPNNTLDSKNVKANDLETVGAEHVGQSQASASTDTITSTSETQVTVSDLDSLSAENTTDGRSALTKSDQESVYYIKWITFGETNVPIITQNENGPCPLLAIMNVLLLKGKVKLAPMLEMVTSEQLMTYLGDCIFENMPQNLSLTSQADYEQNMQDAMSVMHKLQTGLDVNVKFTGVSDFEFTPELIIFDLLGISLYHGWLLDPQDLETVDAVNQDSYNQLVEKIITQKHSEKEEEITQALIAEQFLDRTASQLTYHGLSELSSVVKQDEPCVFFRNNHFSTLYKHNWLEDDEVICYRNEWKDKCE
ncbi:Ubiquitin carboxyl-terminal hydrolase MINDY-2 [Bulinus truncatus]|nr:Ubiquitin carboxyl-terminal hydrolase MINDY-2 [Bulinus truncatus]